MDSKVFIALVLVCVLCLCFICFSVGYYFGIKENQKAIQEFKEKISEIKRRYMK